MKKGVCKLCNQVKELAKAHIVPRSFSLKAKGSSKNLLEARSNDTKDVKDWQNGIWDDGILCAACDNGFSEWDDYGFKTLGDPPGNDALPKNDAEVQTFVLKDLNYEFLKLFVLSVLWKASVTSQPFFSRIKLGIYEEQIANVLRTRKAGAYDQFPVVLARIVKQRFPNAMFHPYRQRSPEGINFCVLFLPSIKIKVKLDQRPLPQIFETIVLKPQLENIALPIPLHANEAEALRDSAAIFRRFQNRAKA